MACDSGRKSSSWLGLWLVSTKPRLRVSPIFGQWLELSRPILQLACEQVAGLLACSFMSGSCTGSSNSKGKKKFKYSLIRRKNPIFCRGMAPHVEKLQFFSKENYLSLSATYKISHFNRLIKDIYIYIFHGICFSCGKGGRKVEGIVMFCYVQSGQALKGLC